MATATEIDHKEARRQKLAREAADYEKHQAELKALHETVKALEAAEKKRLEDCNEALKNVLKERGRLQSKVQASGTAIELLRQEYVSAEIRLALSAAGREERAAKSVAERSAQDISRGADSLAALKLRVKTIPSEVSAAEIRREIQRVQDGQAGLEAAHAAALEAHAAAVKRHEDALAAHKAAMDAARAL